MNAKPYHTSDFALVAFLLTSGFRLQAAKLGRMANSRLEDIPSLADQALQFIDAQSSVEPRQYTYNMKMLKVMTNGRCPEANEVQCPYGYYRVVEYEV